MLDMVTVLRQTVTNTPKKVTLMACVCDFIHTTTPIFYTMSVIRVTLNPDKAL